MAPAASSKPDQPVIEIAPAADSRTGRAGSLPGLELPVFEPIFAPLSAAPVPRELMLAAVFLFLALIAVFFALR